MHSHIHVERNGGTLEVTLCRAELKNALTRGMYDELGQAIQSVEVDPDLRVVLLMAEGDVFCAGNDVSEFAGLSPDFDIKACSASNLFRLLNSTDVPLVAAVQGAAIGVGTTMLMHFDYVVASSDAFFQTPFVDLGLVAECGFSITLPSTMTHQQASEITLLGERIDAVRAASLGFVNQVVEPDSLLKKARDVASRIARKPQQALRLNKSLLKNNRAAVDRRIDEELTHLLERLTSREVQQMIAALSDNRV